VLEEYRKQLQNVKLKAFQLKALNGRASSQFGWLLKARKPAVERRVFT